jgi:hypothetical protein
MQRGKKNIQGDSCIFCPVYGPALHGDHCISDCKAHANIADESVCLMADNVWN